MRKSSIIFSFGYFLLTGCKEDAGNDVQSRPAAPSELPQNVSTQHEKVRLEISDIELNQGYLQLKVHNHTSSPLDLINITWYFFRKDGSQVMRGDYPQALITTAALGGTIIEAKGSKVYTNRLITFSESLSEPFDELDAEIKIYMRRSDFKRLGLRSDIECYEDKIRQVYQSERLVLKTGNQAKVVSPPNAPQQDNLSPELKENVVKYMRLRWQAISASSNGYDPDKHDDLIASEAAENFGITKSQATKIYVQSEMQAK